VLRGSRVRRVATPLALFVSVFFGYLAVRDVNAHELRSAFAQANLWWLVPALGVLAAAVGLRALRWRLLFAPERRPPLDASVRALIIGYFFDSVVFSRSGDAARIVYLHQKTRVSRMETLGVTVAERLYDLVALLVLIPIAVPFFPDAPWLEHVAVVAAIAVIVGVVLAVAVVVAPARTEAALRRLSGRTFERLGEAVANMAVGLRGSTSGLRVASMLGISVAIWLVTAISFWCCLIAFQLDLGLDAGLFVLVAVSLAVMIPILPAALGVFEGAVVLALSAYDVDKSTALSCAVALHAVNVLPFVVVGAAVLHGHVRSVARGIAAADPTPTNRV
jgi:glycosyltransferase 2 family protein